MQYNENDVRATRVVFDMLRGCVAMGSRTRHVADARWFFWVAIIGPYFAGLLKYAGFLFFIFIGVMVPDAIEPAHHWTHRGFFHSKRMLGVVVIFALMTGLIGMFYEYSWYASGVLIGYALHLLRDSTTPRGLPR